MWSTPCVVHIFTGSRRLEHVARGPLRRFRNRAVGLDVVFQAAPQPFGHRLLFSPGTLDPGGASRQNHFRTEIQPSRTSGFRATSVTKNGHI
jgi:hypothetical protein